MASWILAIGKEKEMGKVPFNARRSDCLWLDPDEVQIVTDKNHPLFDSRALLPVDEKLVTNILFEMQGVLEPILVAKDGEGNAIVIDGRQRTKALRSANKKLRAAGAEPLQIPCLLKRGDDNQIYAMSISTNEQRREDTAKEKAVKAARLLNQGYTQAEAGRVFGVSAETIKRWESSIGPAKAPQQEKAPRKPRGIRPRAEILERLGKEQSGTEIAAILRWVLREE